MASDVNARRLVVVSAGLAAVGLASLALTFAASDGTTRTPATVLDTSSTTVSLPTTPAPPITISVPETKPYRCKFGPTIDSSMTGIRCVD